MQQDPDRCAKPSWTYGASPHYIYKTAYTESPRLSPTKPRTTVVFPLSPWITPYRILLKEIWYCWLYKPEHWKGTNWDYVHLRFSVLPRAVALYNPIAISTGRVLPTFPLEIPGSHFRTLLTFASIGSGLQESGIWSITSLNRYF